MTAAYIPASTVRQYKARINAKITDAAAALLAAEDKLGQVLDEFDHEASSGCDRFEVKELRINVYVLGGLLDNTATPSLPTRVFSAIASHANEHAGNTPHLEGAILALMLAQQSLLSALEMAAQFEEGDEIDAAYQTPFAVWSIVKGMVATLSCAALAFDHEEAIAGILRSKRTLELVA